MSRAKHATLRNLVIAGIVLAGLVTPVHSEGALVLDQPHKHSRLWNGKEIKGKERENEREPKELPKGLNSAAGILLHLRLGSFDPLLGEPFAATKLRREMAQEEIGLRLVQFSGPIQDEWHEAMLASGLEVVSYIPDYAYLVWGSGSSVNRLASLVPLRWSGVYQPYYALHPSLIETLKLHKEEEVAVNVQLYAYAGVDTTLHAIQKQAQKIIAPPYPVLNYLNLRISVPSSQLTALASLPGVVNIEPYAIPKLLDEVQTQILAGNLNAAGTQPSGPGYLAWLQSLGFPTNPNEYPIIDITDDGIEDGDDTPIHPDFFELGNTANPDRLVYNYNWTSDPSANGVGGHGTINASIAVGYNNSSGFPYEDNGGYNYGLGVNPFGRVGGSKVFRNNGSWGGPSANTSIISRTYSLGGRISSNSWGASTDGDYTVDDQEYDALVRDAQPGAAFPGNQEITIIFAAGNDGAASGTTGSPANAKNVISVGAAENYRPGWTDGCGIGSSGADSAQDIAFFSSRGPTDDGRVKPEVVAPGTHVQGAASQISEYGGNGVCDRYMPSGQTLYAASSGTSHSTPAVAGAASLIHYWYRTKYGNGQPPSPAMMKAYLVNSTRYLTGSGAGSNLPSNSQGFGEPWLAMAFDNVPRIVVDQSHLFGSTGQEFVISGAVANPARPFRVTLAWTDAPGPTFGNAHVNNLDLEVTVGGQTYKGNVFSGRFSVPGGTADPRNNVESVFLPAGTVGSFTVRVRAANIAGNGVPGNADPTDQDFALVIYNGTESVGYLEGFVYDGAASSPLSGASVRVVTGSASTTTTTDASGYFTLTLAAGTYTVSAWKYGYTTSGLSNVVVQTNTVTTVALTLTPTALYSLTGQVTSAATNAPLSATVSVFGPFGDLVTETATVQQTGQYTLTLFGGSYTVEARARLHAPSSVSLNLVTDTVQNFALTATTTDGLLWGYVRSLDSGLPIQGALIQVAPSLSSTTSAADGYYELQLPSGTPFTITVSAPLYNSVSESGVVLPQSGWLRRDYLLPQADVSLNPGSGLSVTLRFPSRITQPLVLSSTGSAALTFEAWEEPVVTGTAAIGPRLYYTYSVSVGGPGFSWIDATDGTALNLSDDGGATVVLPFAFSFYGISSTVIRVGNNGGILFGTDVGDVPYVNAPLADTSAPDFFIAPFWDDIDSDFGNVYYKTVGTAPNRRFVVEWHNRPHYNLGSGSGGVTFQLILYEGTNAIKFQYQDVFFGSSAYDRGASATVGIRGMGVIGEHLQYSHNQPVLTDTLAICFRIEGGLPCDVSLTSLVPSEDTYSPGHISSSSSVTYSYSASLGAPSFGWVDATDGISLRLGDEDEATVVLPFAFSFYGISSTVIRVGNNGGILFGTTGGDVPFGNAPLTATSAPDFFIAPFWDDIDSDFGNVYFKTVGTAPNRRFVVEWHNRPHYNLGSGSGGVTFQLILYEGTNAIKFQYQDVFFGSSAYDRGASATVGIRGGSTSQVVQYSFNQPVLTDTLAICFRLAGAPPCDAGDIPWLSAVPMQGVVPAASALSVNVGFDSRFVSPGVYTGFLQLHTNAPQAQPFIRYPVTMTVLEPYRSYVPLVRRP